MTTRGSQAGELFFGRGFQMEGLYFKQDNYSVVRDFFNKVQAVDEEQAVLRRGESNVRSAN